MTMEQGPLPIYVLHPGTVKVSATTIPRKAAWCAYAFIEEKRKDVEFLFIGASAGQQTHKAIGILSEIFDSKWRGDYILVFRPMRFMTTIVAHDNVASRQVDAQVWRVHILDLHYRLVPNEKIG